MLTERDLLSAATRKGAALLSWRALRDPLVSWAIPKASAHISLCCGTLHAGTKPDYILCVPCASILGSPRPCGL